MVPDYLEIHSLLGGSSFGGVFDLSQAGDNSKYAFDFGQETVQHKMINFLRYREFLRRIEESFENKNLS